MTQGKILHLQLCFMSIYECMNMYNDMLYIFSIQILI